jgi:RNA polymerase sigma-70 factor (ECF subfamily)
VEDEARWVEEARRGDSEAFGQLVGLHQRAVYAFIAAHLGPVDAVDELTQDAFVKAWKGIRGFRGDCALRTWLCQIALNVVRGWLRAQKVRRLWERGLSMFRDDEGKDPILETVPDRRSDADPVGTAERGDLGGRLRRAVAALPPREQAVFRLRHDDGWPLAEIGRAMGIAEGTVKAHLFHAVTSLRRQMEERP